LEIRDLLEDLLSWTDLHGWTDLHEEISYFAVLLYLYLYFVSSLLKIINIHISVQYLPLKST